jgi:phosphoribosyl 1,2-cyclic phosphodiesterase
MIRFLIVASGSKGNATLIYDERTLFQIDMGIPLKKVSESLLTIGRSFSDMAGVLITHDHSDHIGTVSLLPPAVQVYATKGTLAGTREIDAGKPLSLGNFLVTPFAVSHDAANPVGFLIENHDEKLVYVTDTGYLSEDNITLLRGATYYIFESNHDYKMLLHSHRPIELKHRIHSDIGHLSNADSAYYMAELVTEATKGIYLAHLSEECNTPELAKSAYEKAFQKHGLSLDKLTLECASQWEPLMGGDR